MEVSGMNGNPNEVLLNFYVDREIKKKIITRAIQMDTSLKALMTKIVTDYLENK